MRENNKQGEIISEWNSIWKRAVTDGPKQIFTGFLFKNGFQEFDKYLEGENFSFLEVGAGSGRYGLAIANAYPSASVTVTDPSDSSVDGMLKVKNELNISNAYVSKENALNLSYCDGTFDYVLADAVIQHIVEYPKAIVEMLRVLKPGGKLIVSTVNTYNPPHFLYKSYLKLFNKQYEYEYENTFTRKQLCTILKKTEVDNLKLDGFAVAYGLMRLKKYSLMFHRLGSRMHKVIKIIDGITNRWLTRVFGFEIFIVATKSNSTHEKTN